LKKIPPFKLIPESQDEEASNLPKFKWAGKEIGTRHRLGGQPEFLQDKAWPECLLCRERMTFYGQLDSINDEFDLADCGLIYVFVCFGCFETKSILQSH
jgi:hypothetical protein